MIKEYSYPFTELNVESSDLEELLGFEDNDIPEPFPGLIEAALKEAPEFCIAKGGFKVFNSTETDSVEGTIKIEDQLFFPAKIIITQLKNATGAALFACTAGNEITEHSKKIAAQGDFLNSYIYDVIGSVVVEKAMDKIQQELENEMFLHGLNISDRFSPGYCEWNVSEQQKLFSLLPGDFCRIKLTGSLLMQPIKSVSGIIGIGPGLTQKGYQCHWCNDVNCIYGKTKRKKINKKNS